MSSRKKCPPNEEDPLFKSLHVLDSLLQFLTRATGQTMIPLKTISSTILNGVPFEHLQIFLRHAILQISPTGQLEELQGQWKMGKECNSALTIGFPSPDEKRLSGSTKAAAKRRLAALKKRIKQDGSVDNADTDTDTDTYTDKTKKDFSGVKKAEASSKKDWTLPIALDKDPDHLEEPVLEQERDAKKALQDMFGLTKDKNDNGNDNDSFIPTTILPYQASYAGSHKAQDAEYDQDFAWKKHLDPRIVNAIQRKLYRHQALAIQSALRYTPTLVCTGTGSGKSLCFLVPVLNAALRGERSLLLFPTKALAQDQVVKLQAWLREHGLNEMIRAGTLDGDTPHNQRVDICTSCNIILTNPDTLHAAILPNWKHLYHPLLSNLRYVVLDEAHMYQGVFGAHVSMILARLYRLVCLHNSQLCFLACSATLAHPKQHFRLLCCIPQDHDVNIVTNDTSPRAAKHFWVWNPPLLDMHGKSLGQVKKPRKRKHVASEHTKSERKHSKSSSPPTNPAKDGPIDLSSSSQERLARQEVLRRRHSADETALLLARAVSQGVRCIAFCKTRGLVEWVYERTLAALKQSPKTAGLCSRVESYRGGYTKLERRQIEGRLFNNQLLGVVGTSALELGVDIGGVDLTLHCGFPSSHASLLQQSGRAGRGGNASTSLAVCVCFNSPIDQHLWRYPSSLLTRGLSAPLSMPIYPGLVQGHLLCAGEEFPLAGSLNVSVIQSTGETPGGLLSDENLFGSIEVYREALETLVSQGSVIEEYVAIAGKQQKTVIYKTHLSIKNPWTKVSIRSMESVNYDIVDISHPMQGGRTDGIHGAAAVMDTIPYSRVFYHAFPGAIIMHRGRRYKIMCMTRPPAFGKGFRGSMTLGAFAKPCNHRYFTRPLSNLKITVVKQMERVDLQGDLNKSSREAPAQESTEASSVPVTPDVTEIYSDSMLDASSGSFAGCGVVTVKRNVHGYKKVSIVTREELSRSELSLPDMEYDTLAFWLDCDATVLGRTMCGQDFGYGIHALSHAILAVAPLFVPCVMSDVQCDHSVYNPTRVTIFDARAGGSGICAQLWKTIFIPKGLVEAAIGLLEDCPSCSSDKGYEGGCPACLQAGECIKFNDFLCKSSGLIIAKHLLKRLKQTRLYEMNAGSKLEGGPKEESFKVARQMDARDVTSPRRKARERAMRNAKDICSARNRQVVVGRPSWPMDPSHGPRHENPD
jgi:DEAD/DEAH box helicase domain-containing protein